MSECMSVLAVAIFSTVTPVQNERRSQCGRTVCFNATLRVRSIGLIRLRRTPLFSDDAFDWVQLNPDESSKLIPVACSDGGAGARAIPSRLKKRGGGGERRKPTPAHVRTHTWCKVQILESAQPTHSAWTRVRVAGGAVRTCSVAWAHDAHYAYTRYVRTYRYACPRTVCTLIL